MFKELSIFFCQNSKGSEMEKYEGKLHNIVVMDDYHERFRGNLS